MVDERMWIILVAILPLLPLIDALDGSGYRTVSDCVSVNEWGDCVETTNERTEYHEVNYGFVRWFVSVAAILSAILLVKCNRYELPVVLVAIAVIFNPFKVLSMERETWIIMDYIALCAFVGAIGFSVLSLIKEHDENYSKWLMKRH